MLADFVGAPPVDFILNPTFSQFLTDLIYFLFASAAYQRVQLGKRALLAPVQLQLPAINPLQKTLP